VVPTDTPGWSESIQKWARRCSRRGVLRAAGRGSYFLERVARNLDRVMHDPGVPDRRVAPFSRLASRSYANPVALVLPSAS